MARAVKKKGDNGDNGDDKLTEFKLMKEYFMKMYKENPDAEGLQEKF